MGIRLGGLHNGGCGCCAASGNVPCAGCVLNQSETLTLTITSGCSLQFPGGPFSVPITWQTLTGSGLPLVGFLGSFVITGGAQVCVRVSCSTTACQVTFYFAGFTGANACYIPGQGGAVCTLACDVATSFQCNPLVAVWSTAPSCDTPLAGNCCQTTGTCVITLTE